MLTGLMFGLVAGAALGVVVGLLVRAGHVTAARTAEARLADAVDQNRLLADEVQGLRSHSADAQHRLASAQADISRLQAELDHERRPVDR